MELREPFLVFQPDRAIAENPAITDGLTNPNYSPQLNAWKKLALGWGGRDEGSKLRLTRPPMQLKFHPCRTKILV